MSTGCTRSHQQDKHCRLVNQREPMTSGSSASTPCSWWSCTPALHLRVACLSVHMLHFLVCYSQSHLSFFKYAFTSLRKEKEKMNTQCKYFTERKYFFALMQASAFIFLWGIGDVQPAYNNGMFIWNMVVQYHVAGLAKHRWVAGLLCLFACTFSFLFVQSVVGPLTTYCKENKQ